MDKCNDWQATSCMKTICCYDCAERSSCDEACGNINEVEKDECEELIRERD